jgi:hypothetical protein
MLIAPFSTLERVDWIATPQQVAMTVIGKSAIN